MHVPIYWDRGIYYVLVDLSQAGSRFMNLEWVPRPEFDPDYMKPFEKAYH